MRDRRFILPCRWLALCLLIVPCSAQNTTPSFPPADAQLWEFGVWGAEALGMYSGQTFGESQMSMAGLHVGRVIYERRSKNQGTRTLEYAIEIQPLFLVTRPQHVYGGGFSPVGLKWNFVPRGRYRPYLEWNGGGMFTESNVPPGRTSTFNFTISGGPGVMIALSRTQALSVAVRYWHLSNANLGHSNPAFNTVQVEIGYHWMKQRSGRRPQASQAPSRQGTSGRDLQARGSDH
jgi:hypothetical protein